MGFSIADTVPDEKEIRKALGKMRQGKAPGPSRIKVDDLKDWAHAYEEGEQREKSGWEIPESMHERAMHWMLIVVLVQEIFKMGHVPESF